jgi:putative FmdB family regulatory protein
MPTYTYLCSDCGHRFDTVQRMSADPLTDCPQCAKPALVRQVQAVGFALKGSGWYVTDFRDKGKTPAKTGDGDGAAKADAPAEAKPADGKPSDSKPADSTSTAGKAAASAD